MLAPFHEKSEEEDWEEYISARAKHDMKIEDLHKWDDEFARKMDTTILCKLVEACDYLDISN